MTMLFVQAIGAVQRGVGCWHRGTQMAEKGGSTLALEENVPFSFWRWWMQRAALLSPCY